MGAPPTDVGACGEGAMRGDGRGTEGLPGHVPGAGEESDMLPVEPPGVGKGEPPSGWLPGCCCEEVM